MAFTETSCGVFIWPACIAGILLHCGQGDMAVLACFDCSFNFFSKSEEDVEIMSPDLYTTDSLSDHSTPDETNPVPKNQQHGSWFICLTSVPHAVPESGGPRFHTRLQRDCLFSEFQRLWKGQKAWQEPDSERCSMALHLGTTLILLMKCMVVEAEVEMEKFFLQQKSKVESLS